MPIGRHTPVPTQLTPEEIQTFQRHREELRSALEELRHNPLPEDLQVQLEDLGKEHQKKLQEELKMTDWLSLLGDDEAELLLTDKLLELEDERKTKQQRITDHEANYYQLAQQLPEEKREWFLEYWNDLYVTHLLRPPVKKLDRTIARLTHDLFTVKRRKGTITYNSKQEEWEDLKQRASERSIEDVATPYLEFPRRHGNIISARCPFHQEKTASFYLYLNDNHFHCYGCQAHGDTIDFYMKLKEVDFKTAIQELA